MRTVVHNEGDVERHRTGPVKGTDNREKPWWLHERLQRGPQRKSQFALYLPALDAPESVEAGALQTDLPLGNGELILVVDDEKSIREITRGISPSQDKLLFSSQHVVEIANAVLQADTHDIVFSERTPGLNPVNMPVERTFLGLMISAGTIVTNSGSLLHYCVSREGTELREYTARAIAKLISRLCGCAGEASLIKRSGVFHVIIPAPPAEGKVLLNLRVRLSN